MLGAPPASKDDKPLVRALKKAYLVTAIAAISGEITTVIYSTIVIKKLAETTVAPATSVVALIISSSGSAQMFVSSEVYSALWGCSAFARTWRSVRRSAVLEPYSAAPSLRTGARSSTPASPRATDRASATRRTTSASSLATLPW